MEEISQDESEKIREEEEATKKKQEWCGRERGTDSYGRVTITIYIK